MTTSGLRENHPVEDRHRSALRRIYQADRMLADDGREPSLFHLMYTGGGRRMDHPRWDPSWAVPDEHTIDDLDELGLLRVQPSTGKSRSFVLKMRGRDEAEAFVNQSLPPTSSVGRAPSAREVLRWLLQVAHDEPSCFDIPERLLDRAVTEGLIETTGREALAQRIVALYPRYLQGDLPELAFSSAEHRLVRGSRLQLTVEAEQSVDPQRASDPAIAVFGSVINSQLAAGDINNFVTFTDVLARAQAEVDALEDVAPQAKAEATGILDRLRAGSITAASGMATGAGGALAAQVLAQLLGLHP